MARARNAGQNSADEALKEAFIAHQKWFMETFPTDIGRAKLAKLERGEPVYVPVTDLWKAAFRAGLPCADDLLEASREPLIIEISREGIFIVGIDENGWHDRPGGSRNRHRDAVNTRWLRR